MTTWNIEEATASEVDELLDNLEEDVFYVNTSDDADDDDEREPVIPRPTLQMEIPCRPPIVYSPAVYDASYDADDERPRPMPRAPCRPPIVYSPITPSPPQIASPTPPPQHMAIYSPITPPMVPPIMPTRLGLGLASPTLSEVMSAVAAVSPTMRELLAADAKEGPPTLEMLRSMPPQTIAPRVGGQYYSAVSDDEDNWGGMYFFVCLSVWKSMIFWIGKGKK